MNQNGIAPKWNAMNLIWSVVDTMQVKTASQSHLTDAAEGLKTRTQTRIRDSGFKGKIVNEIIY
ncbi:MAG: hypothetical protein FD177_455 [Desulfovibrionaceae bacterium]|nr:MAG: hypothetical protein FD177_455 [Desulfovibrionaceae bacterium]